MIQTSDKSKKRLYKAVLAIKDEKECEAFLTDLCSAGEINSLCQRIEVAMMLDRGCTYAEINDSTKASTATICRVNRAFSDGEFGYKTIIPRIREE